jgi:hypothetical protein
MQRRTESGISADKFPATNSRLGPVVVLQQATQPLAADDFACDLAYRFVRLDQAAVQNLVVAFAAVMGDLLSNRVTGVSKTIRLGLVVIPSAHAETRATGSPAQTPPPCRTP